MLKKICSLLSLFMCIVMIITILPACGNDTPAAEQPPVDEQNETNGSAEQQQDIEDSDTTKLVDEELTITIMKGEHPSQPINPDAPIYNEIYKKTGIKVDIQGVPGSDYEQKARTLLATDSMPDVMQIYFNEIREFANTGIFLPISDYLDEYAPNFKRIKEEIPQLKSFEIDGKLYYFPQLARHMNKMGQVPMIRLDILEELNLDMPEDFDQLYETLKKIKEAYPDVYPFTNRNGTNNLLTCVAYPMGSGAGIYFDKDIDGGRYVYGSVTQDFKEILGYLNKLFEEQILDPDYAVATAQQWQEKLSTGRAFFYYDNPSFAINFNKALQEENPDYRFGPMPIMKNSKGAKRNLFYDSHWYQEGYVISSKTKNPEAVIRLYDWFYSEEGADLLNFGILGTHYTKENGEYKVSQDLIDKSMQQSDPYRAYMGELGAGLLAIAPYIDERNQWPFMADEVKAWYDQWAQDEGMFERTVAPIFTEEEIEKLKELTTKVDTILTNEIDKFIMGERPLDEFDQIAEKAIEAGALEIERIYNDALARMQ